MLHLDYASEYIDGQMKIEKKPLSRSGVNC